MVLGHPFGYDSGKGVDTRQPLLVFLSRIMALGLESRSTARHMCRSPLKRQFPFPPFPRGQESRSINGSHPPESRSI